MKMLLSLNADERNWLAKWTIYPLLVYYASFLFLYLMPLVFILLLTLVQWKRLERLTNHAGAGYWVLVIFVYPAFIWLGSYWHFTNRSLLAPENIACGAFVYYGTQTVGGLFIKPLADHWRWRWYLAGNVLATLQWIVGIFLTNWLITGYVTSGAPELIWLFVCLPLLGLQANLIVGLGLLTAVAPPVEQESVAFTSL